MWAKYLCIALVFFMAGCGSKDSKTTTKTIIGEDGKPVTVEVKEEESNGFWERLEMVELKDNNGTILAIRPFPPSWKIGSTLTTGPHGITIKSIPLRMFMINYNQAIARAYANQQQREMPGVEQLIQQDFVPWAQNEGMQLVNFYEIPEISKMDKWYAEQFYAAMPSRLDVGAFGIEWKKNDGTPYFQILHLRVNTSDAMQNWSYYVDGLEADADHIETAKKQLIFGLTNTRFNLEPIAKFNREEAERCGQSWAAHNARMARNQANFEAQQRDFVNRSNAAHDALMSGWKARDAASDRMQEANIDRIYERTNAQNTETGQMYKVSAGANQYWMNSNGEYISTKQNDYNPNLDENMNQQRWQQLKEVKKN